MPVPAITTSFKSEKGRRPENEDSGLVLGANETGGRFDALLVVADGMGGRASGATASATALETVRDSLLHGPLSGDFAADLSRALQAANETVFRLAGSKSELQGMGTTCVATALKDGKAYLAYMGDSRGYLLRDGKLSQLTEDHSFVAEKVKSGELTEEQARTSRFRNVITKAVGLDPKASPDSASVELQPGDVILLCTDGLTTVVRDSEIADIMCTSSNPDEACSRLVNTALKQGSRDNITVAMAAYGSSARRVPATSSATSSQKGPSAGRFFTILFMLLLGIAIGFYGPRLYKLATERTTEPQATVQPSAVEYENPVVLLSHKPLQGRFISPGPKGYLYVVDTQGIPLMVSTSGELDASYPSRTTFGSAGVVRQPSMASDADGNLYVSDPAGKRIQKFDSKGIFLADIGAGRLEGPEALTVAENGDIFVIDAGRLKVLKVRMPASNTEGTAERE